MNDNGDRDKILKALQQHLARNEEKAREPQRGQSLEQIMQKWVGPGSQVDASIDKQAFTAGASIKAGSKNELEDVRRYYQGSGHENAFEAGRSRAAFEAGLASGKVNGAALKELKEQYKDHQESFLEGRSVYNKAMDSAAFYAGMKYGSSQKDFSESNSYGLQKNLLQLKDAFKGHERAFDAGIDASGLVKKIDSGTRTAILNERVRDYRPSISGAVPEKVEKPTGMMAAIGQAIAEKFTEDPQKINAAGKLADQVADLIMTAGQAAVLRQQNLNVNTNLPIKEHVELVEGKLPDGGGQRPRISGESLPSGGGQPLRISGESTPTTGVQPPHPPGESLPSGGGQPPRTPGEASSGGGDPSARIPQTMSWEIQQIQARVIVKASELQMPVDQKIREAKDYNTQIKALTEKKTELGKILDAQRKDHQITTGTIGKLEDVKKEIDELKLSAKGANTDADKLARDRVSVADSNVKGKDGEHISAVHLGSGEGSTSVRFGDESAETKTYQGKCAPIVEMKKIYEAIKEGKADLPQGSRPIVLVELQVRGQGPCPDCREALGKFATAVNKLLGGDARPVQLITLEKDGHLREIKISKEGRLSFGESKYTPTRDNGGPAQMVKEPYAILPKKDGSGTYVEVRNRPKTPDGASATPNIKDAPTLKGQDNQTHTEAKPKPAASETAAKKSPSEKF